MSHYIPVCNSLSPACLQERNLDGTSHFPYRHPVIQKAVNLTWFQNKDSDGIVFYGRFTPIPIKAMALVLTVVRIEARSYRRGY